MYLISVDNEGEPVKVSYETLDKMRVTSHTLKEIRPIHGGNFCEILYRLITSLDCFLLHWKVSQPELIDHYRVYQIKIDSGVAKLLGHVTEPYFKVTWFEIPDHEKDEQVHHFKFVIRPVLRNGVAVPLDYNFCKLFHVASTKDSVKLVKDSCTAIDSKEKEDNKELKPSPGQKSKDVNDCIKGKRNEVVTACNNSSNVQCQDASKKCDKGKTSGKVGTGKAKGKKKEAKASDIEKLTENLNISDE